MIIENSEELIISEFISNIKEFTICNKLNIEQNFNNNYKYNFIVNLIDHNANIIREKFFIYFIFTFKLENQSQNSQSIIYLKNKSKNLNELRKIITFKSFRNIFEEEKNFNYYEVINYNLENFNEYELVIENIKEIKNIEIQIISSEKWKITNI